MTMSDTQARADALAVARHYLGQRPPPTVAEALRLIRLWPHLGGDRRTDDVLTLTSWVEEARPQTPAPVAAALFRLRSWALR